MEKHDCNRVATAASAVSTLSNRAHPNLKKALLGAMVTVPGLAAALEEGDNDLDLAAWREDLVEPPEARGRPGRYLVPK